MSNEVLIRAEGVSKKFCRNLKKSLIYGGYDIIKGFLGIERSEELRKDEFWAVNDINFEVRRGECLGLIGHNGAGKSTLLKMLNGLIRPDKGRIEMHGKVGALIELGAGFSPLLTGRENIYNNGAILGFTKEEIDRKFDEIVEFSEIADFIDSPVQNYSSGMKVRLGFAIAAQMQPDILLIDEVLAVGDIGFVLKCFNRIDKLLQNTALIFVSHSMPQVARMCTQVLMMDHGKILTHTSQVSDGITQYYKSFKTEIGNYRASEDAELKDLFVIHNNKQYQRNDELVIEYGDSMTIEIHVECRTMIRKPHVYIAFYDNEQRNFAEITNCSDVLTSRDKSGLLVFRTTIPRLDFSQGKYSISIGFSDKDALSKAALFRYQSAIYFTVHGNVHGWAPLQYSPDWQML